MTRGTCGNPNRVIRVAGRKRRPRRERVEVSGERAAAVTTSYDGNDPTGVIDLPGVRVPAVVLASVTALAFAGAACTTTTSGAARPVRATVTVVSTTVVSTVTASPPQRTQRVFDTESVEGGVSRLLREDYRISDVGAAECPEDQPVVPGTSFRCEVEVGGRVRQVTRQGPAR
ncbi:DUF4333 domain-containing protein [Saccharothrix sp. Mg75]|uniref:DUF4333 domain-containing protein n=1 Tax=Saccharothrix sp. Mg75 TaxID=3445357 RepID=UPI003EED3877